MTGVSAGAINAVYLATHPGTPSGALGYADGRAEWPRIERLLATVLE